MWFDELGPPWPKHACFDDDYAALKLRKALAGEPGVRAAAAFGVVTETEVIEPGKCGRIVVACSDSELIDDAFDTNWDLVLLAGSLMLIVRDEDNGLGLQRVSTGYFGGWRYPPRLAAGAKLVFEGRQYVLVGSKWCNAGRYTLVPTSLQQRLDQEVARLLRSVT